MAGLLEAHQFDSSPHFGGPGPQRSMIPEGGQVIPEGGQVTEPMPAGKSVLAKAQPVKAPVAPQTKGEGSLETRGEDGPDGDFEPAGTLTTADKIGKGIHDAGKAIAGLF